MDTSTSIEKKAETKSVKKDNQKNNIKSKKTNIKTSDSESIVTQAILKNKESAAYQHTEFLKRSCIQELSSLALDFSEMSIGEFRQIEDDPYKSLHDPRRYW